jgi:hypothetical protein
MELRQQSKRGANIKKNKDSSNQSLLDALNNGTKSESKMAALWLILEFGTAAQKAEAMKEIQSVAYGDRKKSNDMIAQEESERDEDDEGDSNDSDSATTLNN